VSAVADVEIGTGRTLGTAGRDLVRAAVSAWEHGEATGVALDGERIAYVVPLADVPASAELLGHLAAVDRAQAAARSHMPDGSLGDFPLPAELASLRALAEAVRSQQQRFEVRTIREDTQRKGT
jgi:hypothetical protein